MTSKSREIIIQTFLVELGLKEASRKALAGDASFRSYQRLESKAGTLVLMNAPPAHEDVRPFVAVAGYLRLLGLSAPEVIAKDLKNGLLLLEDLGDDTFNRVLDQAPDKTGSLYRSAIEALGHLHQTTPPQALPLNGEKAVGLRDYASDLLFEELFLFCDWYLPALLDVKNEIWRGELRAIWQPLFESIGGQTPCLTLRDYHADNLMWLPQRQGVARVGLLDFQDAVRGHPAYDLVSRLQEARRPFDQGLEEEMINHYLVNFGQSFNRDEFLKVYEILGAQRNMKIIGIFTRLWKRDGKGEYPEMIPHVWTLLEKNLTHPALAEAKTWIDKIVPGKMRAKRL